MIAKVRRLFALNCLAALLAGFGPAQAGDAAHGEIIARRWCAACHLVSSDQTSAKVDAPPFEDVARRRTDDKELAAFLTDPHPKMPDMSLTRKEIEDIVAYIRRLVPAGRPPAEPGGGKDDEQPRKG